MSADCGVRIAESGAEPAVDTKATQLSPWDAKQRRALLILGVCLGLPACVCRKGGVLRRGVLIFDGMRFLVGSLVVHPSSVGCVTVEPDLITIHVGDLA